MLPKAVTFLTHFGFSFHDILDYDDGMTPTELCLYLKEAHIVTAQVTKKEVYGMAVAVAAIFDQKILHTYIDALDAEIDSGEPDEIATANATAKSMDKMKKLNVLFGGG